MPEPNRVVFRKQVSDGNYGSEVAEVTLDVESDFGETTEQSVAATLANARRLVFDELRHSPSSNVRRALEYPKPVEETLQRRAEESAELELAIGKRQAYADEDEDREDLPY